MQLIVGDSTCREFFVGILREFLTLQYYNMECSKKLEEMFGIDFDVNLSVNSPWAKQSDYISSMCRVMRGMLVLYGVDEKLSKIDFADKLLQEIDGMEEEDIEEKAEELYDWTMSASLVSVMDKNNTRV